MPERTRPLPRTSPEKRRALAHWPSRYSLQADDIQLSKYRVFLHRIRRSFFKYKKNHLSRNIVIGLILKTVHWTMFSLNAIGLEKKCLNEIVRSEKKKFSTLIV